VTIGERIAELRDRIASACSRAGRDPGDIRLVAVAKRHPSPSIRDALAAGVSDIGESYAQELTQKTEELGDVTVRWHFIGRLQRNKVKLVVGVADLIHAVDSVRLLEAIDKRASELGVCQDVLMAVSLAGEEQKTGVVAGALPELLSVARTATSVRVLGLMTMPPLHSEPEDNRRVFAGLRELRDRVARPECPLSVLSMGMTGDFEAAIEEGATHVRVGTAIFGPRPA